MALAHTARMAQIKGISWEDIVKKINKIDWSFDNELWFNILIIPNSSGQNSVACDKCHQFVLLDWDKMTAKPGRKIKQVVNY